MYLDLAEVADEVEDILDRAVVVRGIIMLGGHLHAEPHVPGRDAKVEKVKEVGAGTVAALHHVPLRLFTL